MIEIFPGTQRRCKVGERISFTVLVTDPTSGAAVVDAQIRVVPQDPDALDFGGGRGFIILRTDNEGMATFEVSPHEEGTFDCDVRIGIAVERVTIEAEDDGVRSVRGATIVPGPDGDAYAVEHPVITQPQPRRGRIIVVRPRSR